MPMRQSTGQVHDVKRFRHVRSVSIILLFMRHKGSERAKQTQLLRRWMEHTKRNEATKHSKRAEHYRQKNYIWIILLK